MQETLLLLVLTDPGSVASRGCLLFLPFIMALEARYLRLIVMNDITWSFARTVGESCPIRRSGIDQVQSLPEAIPHAETRALVDRPSPVCRDIPREPGNVPAERAGLVRAKDLLPFRVSAYAARLVPAHPPAVPAALPAQRPRGLPSHPPVLDLDYAVSVNHDSLRRPRSRFTQAETSPTPKEPAWQVVVVVARPATEHALVAPNKPEQRPIPSNVKKTCSQVASVVVTQPTSTTPGATFATTSAQASPSTASHPARSAQTGAGSDRAPRCGTSAPTSRRCNAARTRSPGSAAVNRRCPPRGCPLFTLERLSPWDCR